MPEYINNTSSTVYLPNQHGKIIPIRRGVKISLDQFFDRYVKRGILSHANALTISKAKQAPRPTMVRPQKITRKQIIPRTIKINAPKIEPQPPRSISYSKQSLYPISNDIGIGILTYNRRPCLERLIESIVRHTSLSTTTIFISDDASTDDTPKFLDDVSSDFIVLRNNTNVGIACNSNRLLRCLSRFKFAILLNDDVTILKDGWDSFYLDACSRTGYKHFCMQQPGVYASKLGDPRKVNGVCLRYIPDKPHGAVLAFTTDTLDTIGYFDEAFPTYGLEHVDWSTRMHKAGIQDSGFYDVDESIEYFKINNEVSSVPQKERMSGLSEARRLYTTDPVIYKSCGDKSAVPTVSVVLDNVDEIVRKNIIAQRFPCIDIVDSANNASSEVVIEHHNALAPGKYIQHVYDELMRSSRCNIIRNDILLSEDDKVALRSCGDIPNVIVTKYFAGTINAYNRGSNGVVSCIDNLEFIPM